ncbi:DUF7551 domain-containing protein [Haloarcula salinisoli]|uniref:Uncharacterized protein n=1 Tax=Haloarcula salinisoli TaxID=2487746 RepID=A0A8J7YHL0_9EURY|nr:hypothetical protein [Halomicroarcula salinisoli]MBX0303144.1 hypothetical protein [Halomicroarcula salinisoli]
MVGPGLSDIRARLDDLSVAVGPYRVVSAKTGDGPFPVTGLQFPDRGTAAEGATVASAYRRAFRRYDPRVTVHDLLVTEATTLGATTPRPPRTVPEYCHAVAGALFETLSDRHGPVERTVMDAYLEAAERTSDRDRLCLTMLERAAEALDTRLSTSEQASALLATAGRLPPRSVDDEPLADALQTLQTTGLLAEYALESTPCGPGRRAQRVRLDGYRPSLSADRCPVLPVVVELLRRTAVAPRITDATRTASGWTFLVTTTGDAPAAGLSVTESTI